MAAKRRTMTEILRDQEVFKKIEAILEGRRAAARRELDSRRGGAYAAVPGLEDLELEMAAAGVRHNQALLNGERSLDEARSEIDGEIGGLIQKRDELLNENGLSRDYLIIKYTCDLCGDTGYTAGDDGAPRRCACYKQLLYDSLESSSNIISAGAASFKQFNEALYSDAPDEKKYKQKDSPRDNIRKIKKTTGKFVRAFGNGAYENLYFFGQPGTGKTFMAASIAHELMRGGVAVLYLSAPSLFNAITEHQFKTGRDEGYRDTLYRQIFTCKLLIIDDLGTEAMTESRFSEFISLLNARLAPGNFSTILITNLELKGLQAQYDERIFSRILGSFRIIRFYGEDLRLRRAGGVV